ncbi:unnamed protein product [Ceutorhynchus assimilis]|uniref:Uncharacterized protein n=1 Tax=Ceutorhynchus assimilis TaxID=467358 RepID=A0A9N9QS13_9CUCU|nr:unnamed protein product [Ceutorhynchus assimilis]
MSTKRKHEDASEPFESSGYEWVGQQTFCMPKCVSKFDRTKSARVVKKPKLVAEDSDDEEDKDEGKFSEEEPKGKKAGPKGTKNSKKRSVKDNEDGEGSDGDFKGEEQPQKKKAATKPAAKSSAKATPKNKAATNESEGEEDSSEEDDSDNEDSSVSDKSKTRQPLPKTIYSEDFATDSFVILKKDIKGGPQARPVIWRIVGKLQKFEAFDEGDKVQHRNTSIYTGWSPLDRELYAPLRVDVKSHFKSNLEVVEVHWNELSAVDDSD